MIRLLAWEREKIFSRGWFLHFVFKQGVRLALNFAAEHALRSVLDAKEKNGYANPEVTVYREMLDEMYRRNEVCWIDSPNQKNQDRRLWKNSIRLVCLMLDEDSYYLLRTFYLIEMLHYNYDRLQIEMHKKRAYWNWEEMRAEILASLGPFEKLSPDDSSS